MADRFEDVRTPLTHGTASSYRRGCKCRACKAAYAKVKRERLWERGVHLPMEIYLLHRRDGLKG